MKKGKINYKLIIVIVVVTLIIYFSISYFLKKKQSEGSEETVLDKVKTTFKNPYGTLDKDRVDKIKECIKNTKKPAGYTDVSLPVGNFQVPIAQSGQMYLGKKGNKVKQLQKAINDKFGTNISEDGKFGVQTHCFAKVLLGKTMFYDVNI